MGKYNADSGDNNFATDALFREGNHSTMWKIRYSKDHCYAMFSAIGTPKQIRAFCKRMNGDIPRVKKENDFETMMQAGVSK